MSGLLMVLGGMVAGPGLLAAWNVLVGEAESDVVPDAMDLARLEALKEPPVNADPEPAPTLAPVPEAVPAAAPLKPAWFAEDEDWDEDADDEATVVFQSHLHDPDQAEHLED